jgi:type VI secretion system secreted protein Hcp
MALNAFLILQGQRQGAISGSVTQKGHEGSIEVIAASHEIVSPRDPASGLATGKRLHRPFTITKELDKSTPLLYQAMVTNENIIQWKLQFYTTDINGLQKQDYTVVLTNANIADIRFTMPNNRLPDLMKLKEYEEIEFTYQKIQWTWIDGNITSSDSWIMPNV